MLVLTRKTQERIQIGDDIVITVVRIRGNQVKIGIEAPADLPVARTEILPGELEASLSRRCHLRLESQRL